MLKTILAAFKARQNFDPCQHLCRNCKEPIDPNEREVMVIFDGERRYAHARPCTHKTWATALDREEIERAPGAER